MGIAKLVEQKAEMMFASAPGTSSPCVADAAFAKRQAERVKRRALWDEGFVNIDDNRARRTANGWEHSQLGSGEQKRKFLRLMGGRDLVAALEAASEEDCCIDDSDLPTDCPVFELVEGEMVAVDNTVGGVARRQVME